MASPQELLKKEVRNNQSLHQMNKTLTLENDLYSAALLTLKNHLLSMEQQPTLDQSYILSADEAASLVEEAISKCSQPHCECDRWKQLYVQESEECLQLSKLNVTLQQALSRREKEQQVDQVEIQKLFEDYIQLFRKQVDALSSFPSGKQQEASTSKKKDARSNSKSKPKGSGSKQDRKLETSQTKPTKDIGYARSLMEIQQKELAQLQSQVEQLRIQHIQREQLIRLYRQKQRERLLTD